MSEMDSAADQTSLTEASARPPRAVGARTRLLARLIDLLILIVLGGLSFWLGRGLISDSADIAEFLLGWFFVAIVPAALMVVIVGDEARTGQSPGKAAMGIRAIGPDGQPPGWGRVLARLTIGLLVGRGVTNSKIVHDGPEVETPTVPAIWRDVRVLRVVGQVLVAVAVIAALRLLFHNLVTGMDDKGISRDFDVLQRPTNFEIRDANFDIRSPIWEGILVGVKNTALVAVVGILMATVIGLFVGIARLSSNKLVAWLATIYVETLRNIPPLVVIIFFGFALFTFGPLPAWAISRGQYPWEGRWPGSDGNYLIISKDRWGFPSVTSIGNVGAFWLLLLLALVIAVAVGIWRTRRYVVTGHPHHRLLWSLGVFGVIAVASFLALGGPYDWSWPEISESGRRISNGFASNSGYLALTIALGCYHASFVAEIVRGSILALPRGQIEGASAIGLKSSQQYRHVILPQAQRIAIPPFISECLNLSKNTSLAITVGYFDVTLLVQTAIGNGNPAPQLIGILMAIYLAISLVISFVLNLYNRSIQLKER